MNRNATYIHGTEPTEQERLALLNRLTNAPFLDFLELRGDETVLEVGSGLGILTNEVARALPRGGVYGIEYAEQQLARAERTAVPNVRLIHGDAHALPLADTSFDIVFCRYVLEHVADPVQMLREMRRALRIGGRIHVQENTISLLDFYPECPLFAHVWRRFVSLQSALGGDALIGKKLLVLLRESGFREIVLSVQPEIHYSGLPSFHPWIENIIGNLRGGMSALVAHGLATRLEVRAAIDELLAFRERDDAASFFYWNRAQAIR